MYLIYNGGTWHEELNCHAKSRPGKKQTIGLLLAATNSSKYFASAISGLGLELRLG